jgi:signal transduction histidine kinase
MVRHALPTNGQSLASLAWFDGSGREHVTGLRDSSLSIGRSSSCDVTLLDHKVSKHHAEIRRGPEGDWILVDCDSTNGTWLDGERVRSRVLRCGDRFTIGSRELVFSASPVGHVQAAGVDALGQRVGHLAHSKRSLLVQVPLSDVERQFADRVREGGDDPDLTHRLRLLYRLTSSLNAVSDLDAVCERTLDLILETIDCDRAYLLLSQGTQLVPKVVRHREGCAASGELIPISRSMLAEVVRSGQAIATSDAMSDQRWAASVSVRVHAIRSAVTVPLQVGDNLVGAVQLYRVGGAIPFDEADVQVTTLVCNHAAAAIANARLVSELKSSNEQLRRAREELVRNNGELEVRVAARTEEVLERSREVMRLGRQKDELLGMVAHDLRTPLTGLLGFVEMLSVGVDQQVPYAELAEDVRMIYGIGSGMATLLNDLLDAARIDAGRLELCLVQAPITPVLSDALETAHVELVLDVAESLPVVPHDPRRIGQVLNNLLHNALKFSDAGGRITVRASWAGEAVRVDVIDTGPGMAEGTLARVFGRFERGEAPADGGSAGAGLGVAISRKLVELHGGRIWAESEPGRGSCFSFSLPLSASAAAKLRAAEVRPDEDFGGRTCFDLGNFGR